MLYLPSLRTMCSTRTVEETVNKLRWVDSREGSGWIHAARQTFLCFSKYLVLYVGGSSVTMKREGADFKKKESKEEERKVIAPK